MKFAFAGSDFLGGVFDVLVDAGWQPIKLFSRACDGIHDANEVIVSKALFHKIPVQISRIRDEDIAALYDQHGCEWALIVAGYPWLVKGWSGKLRYAVNVHPSPLPIGRGRYPLCRAVLDRFERWGVTAHVLDTAGFDVGAIVAQDTFSIGPCENHEMLLSKCLMSACRIAGTLAGDIDQLWRNAAPQGTGSYWPPFTDADRTLDFSRDVDDVLRTVRAFGSTCESIAKLDELPVFVASADGWREAHDHKCGTIVHRHSRRVLIAARDGFIQLTRWSPLPRHALPHIGR